MSASAINVHSHPILPAYRKALGKGFGKPPEEPTIYGDAVPRRNAEPVWSVTSICCAWRPWE